MFQLYKYGCLKILRNKTLLFWPLLFPIVLGTFFNIAFGSIIENTENFSEIPVAIVITEDNEQSEYFKNVLTGLSEEADPLLTLKYTDKDEADKLLKDGDVEGIFSISSEIKLIISKSGINQSILKSISDSFLQRSETINNIATSNPEMLTQAITAVSNDIQVIKRTSLGKGETDTFLQYYYALLAMTSLFGCYLGLSKAAEIRGNISSIAARNCVSPRNKIEMILSSFASAVTIHFCMILIVMAYLVFVLNINFGEQWGFVMLTNFIGSIIGVSYGMFLMSASKANEKQTEGILTGTSLLMCFLSGLMAGNMKYIMEQYAPIINRINPAALLSDAYYSLAVYDNYSRYFRNIVSLLVIAVVLCIASTLILRRKQYDNI